MAPGNWWGHPPTPVLLCTSKCHLQTPLVWSLPSLPSTGKGKKWCSCPVELDAARSISPRHQTMLHPLGRAVLLDGAQEPRHH